MAYSDLLKKPSWQKKRLQILERDAWTCRKCGDTEETLNVHHLYYSKGCKPWEYPDEALLTLCETCHQIESVDTDSMNALVIRAIRKSQGPHGQPLLNDWLLDLACFLDSHPHIVRLILETQMEERREFRKVLESVPAQDGQDGSQKGMEQAESRPGVAG